MGDIASGICSITGAEMRQIGWDQCKNSPFISQLNSSISLDWHWHQYDVTIETEGIYQFIIGAFESFKANSCSSIDCNASSASDVFAARCVGGPSMDHVSMQIIRSMFFYFTFVRLVFSITERHESKRRKESQSTRVCASAFSLFLPPFSPLQSNDWLRLIFFNQNGFHDRSSFFFFLSFVCL